LSFIADFAMAGAQYYTIFGQKVGAHIISAVTLGATGFGTWWATRGKKEAGNGPPINASSKEEESFVKDFLKGKDTETKQ